MPCRQIKEGNTNPSQPAQFDYSEENRLIAEMARQIGYTVFDNRIRGFIESLIAKLKPFSGDNAQDNYVRGQIHAYENILQMVQDAIQNWDEYVKQ